MQFIFVCVRDALILLPLSFVSVEGTKHYKRIYCNKIEKNLLKPKKLHYAIHEHSTRPHESSLLDGKA